jgi:hypothetical protein
MKSLLIIFLLVISLVSVPEKSYANELFLKCLSLSAFREPWQGNVSYVKIYPDKSEALFQDTDETTLSWATHNIKLINSELIWLAECRSSKCETDDVGNKRLDRVTGILSMVTKLDGKWHEMFRWQCQKANVS